MAVGVFWRGVAVSEREIFGGLFLGVYFWGSIFGGLFLGCFLVLYVVFVGG